MLMGGGFEKQCLSREGGRDGEVLLASTSSLRASERNFVILNIDPSLETPPRLDVFTQMGDQNGASTKGPQTAARQFEKIQGGCCAVAGFIGGVGQLAA